MLEQPPIDRPKDHKNTACPLAASTDHSLRYCLLLWQILNPAGYFSDPNATDQLDNSLKPMHPTFLLTFQDSANLFIAPAEARI